MAEFASKGVAGQDGVRNSENSFRITYQVNEELVCFLKIGFTGVMAKLRTAKKRG